jgi:predicted RNase H-like HicB family nuclease
MGVQSREPKEGDTVTVTESDGYIVARDESSGVASQGETKSEALANLAEALELHSRPDPEDAEISESTAPWFSDSES